MASLTTTLSIPPMGAAVVPRRRNLLVARAAKLAERHQPAKGDSAYVDGRRAVMFTAAVTALAAVSRPSARAVLGGYSPIDVSDQRVQAIGSWAVKEHNKQTGDKLQFRKVVSGEDQVVAGMNFKLEVDASDGGIIGNYETLVYEPAGPPKSLELTYFKRKE